MRRTIVLLFLLAAALQAQKLSDLGTLDATPASGDKFFILDASDTTSLKGLTYANLMAGNAGTATALAANPADCAANLFAQSIAASGALTCGAIADADVPDDITIDLAAAATALAADPADCDAGLFGVAIAASGALTCDTVDASNIDLTDDYTWTGAHVLDAPTIADFTNAAHDHGDADDGGALAADSVGTSQIDDGTVATADVVAAIKSWPINLTILNLAANTGLYAVQFPAACTIARLSCVTEATETATIQWEERTEADRWSAGTAVATAAMDCVSTTLTTTAFDNATIAANAPMALMITASSDGGVLEVHGTCVAN